MAQPVEETLKGTGVVYVNDGTYQREVFQEHLPGDQRRPVMALFFDNREDYSMGNASLLRTIGDYFPKIKRCGYKISDETHTPKGMLEHLSTLYPPIAKSQLTPAILCYHVSDGKVKYDDQLAGGISKLSTLKENIAIFRDYIPKNILS